MTWFRQDDGFHGHRKVADLESGSRFAEAIALWTLAGGWSAAQLTDGRVPATALRRLVPFAWEPAAAELVRVGLWEKASDAEFQFHDWLDHQPSREEVLSQREANAARQRKKRSRDVTDAVTTSVTHAGSHAGSHGVTGAVTHDAVTPSVTAPRPDPSRPDQSERESDARVASVEVDVPDAEEPLARRMLDAFGQASMDRRALFVTVTPSMRALAEQHAPGLEATARARGLTFDVLLGLALDRWFGVRGASEPDGFASKIGFKFEQFAASAGALVTQESRPTAKARASPRGMAPPTSHADHAREVKESGGKDGIAIGRF